MKTINLGTIGAIFSRDDPQYMWCEQHIGKGAYFDSRAFWDPEVMWCVERSHGNIYFTFRNDEHAMLFALRWV
jgi:hypothetical protein